MTGTLSGATAADGSWVTQLDAPKFDGTVSYFFEALVSGAAGNTGSIRMRRRGTTTDDAIITGPTTATLQLLRVPFTAQTTAFDYIVRNNADGVRSQTIKAARIIAIQDVGSGFLTSSRSQYEIGSDERAVTVSAISVLQKQTFAKYWYYDATNYDGALSFFAEVSYLVSSTTGLKTIVLQEADSTEPSATWNTVVTILNAATGSTTAVRVRSASFLPTHGKYYRLAWTNDSTMSTMSIFTCKIFLRQLQLDEVASDKNSSSTYSVVNNGSTTESGQVFQPTSTGPIASIIFKLKRTGSPAGTLVCNIYNTTGTYGVNAIPTGTAIDSSSNSPTASTISTTDAEVEFTFSGNITLTAGNTYAASIAASTAGTGSAFIQAVVDTTNGYSGNRFIKSGTYSAPDNNDLYFSVKVTPTVFTAGLTKFEEHYLLANTNFAAGTTVQSFLTKWDANEYSDVTLKSIHGVSATDNNTSIIELVDSSAVQLVGSVVTTPDNYSTSQIGGVEDTFGTAPDVSNGTSSNIVMWSTGFNADLGGKVGAVTFILGKSDAAAAGTVRARIYAGTGTYGTNFLPTGAPLAESDPLSTATWTLTNSPKLFTFPAGQNVQLIAGTKYCVALYTTDIIQVGIVNAGGWETNMGYFAISVGNWNTTAGSLPFIVYDTGATEITLPSTDILDVRATTNTATITSSRLITEIAKITTPVTPVDRRINTIT